MSAQLTITIPVWLDFIFTCPLLAYRLLRYGYSFRRIYLGEEEWAIVEPEDYYRFGNFKWGINGSGDRYYAVRNAKTGTGKTKRVYMHREIMNPPAGLFVDHKNNDPLDNRRENLRLATRSQNMQNKRKKKNATSKYFGVHLIKAEKKWSARVKHEGKLVFSARFDNEIDAAHAYDAAAKKYHGEFARLNFPESAGSVQRGADRFE
jgi:HNH endonuclease